MIIETLYNIGDTIYLIAKHWHNTYKDCNYCNNTREITDGIDIVHCPFCFISRIGEDKVMSCIIEEIEYTIDKDGAKMVHIEALDEEGFIQSSWLNQEGYEDDKIFNEKESAEIFFKIFAEK